VRAPKPTELILIRHGQSSANSAGILAGRDPSVRLTDLGRSQAKDLAQRLKAVKIDRIYSSPLTRCLETITPLANEVGKKINTDESFIEMDYGLWSGEKLSKLSKKSEWAQIQRDPTKFRFPEGESFKEMHRRVSNRISEIASPGKTLIICSHGDVIKMLISHLIGLKINSFQQFFVEPASITQILVGENNSLVKANVTDHLKSNAKTGAHRTIASQSTLGGGDIKK
jgi:probable phosphomutase (TIGR03848 family)